jgi:hypothetical protein
MRSSHLVRLRAANIISNLQAKVGCTGIICGRRMRGSPLETLADFDLPMDLSVAFQSARSVGQCLIASLDLAISGPYLWRSVETLIPTGPAMVSWGKGNAAYGFGIVGGQS